MDIRLLGKTYTIKSDQNPEFTLKASEFLDEKIRELKERVGPCAPEKIAILTALNLAGEHLQLQKDSKAKIEHLEKELEHILANLDESLKDLNQK